jgi:hypothetical protein
MMRGSTESLIEMMAGTAKVLNVMSAALRGTEMVLLRGTEVMLLRRAEVMLRGTVMMPAETAATHVMAAAESTPTHMAAAHVAAATHMTTASAVATAATMHRWQIRTQTQNEGCCQSNRHPADPGTHILFLLLKVLRR